MLDRLPVELKLILLRWTIHSSDDDRWKLQKVNRNFYTLANEIFKEKVSNLIDMEVLDSCLISKFINGIDFWIGPLTKLVYPDLNYHFIHFLLTNRRIYFDEKDVEIPPTSNGSINDYKIVNGTLHLEEVNSLSFKKTLRLPKGFNYIWSLCLVCHDYSQGLNDLKFRTDGLSWIDPLQGFYRVIPIGEFTSLFIGTFRASTERYRYDGEIVEDADKEYLSVEISMIGSDVLKKVDLLYFQIETPLSPAPNVSHWGYIQVLHFPYYKENIFERLVYMNFQGLRYSDGPIELNQDISFKSFYTPPSRSQRKPMISSGPESTYIGRFTYNSVRWRNPFV